MIHKAYKKITYINYEVLGFMMKNIYRLKIRI